MSSWPLQILSFSLGWMEVRFNNFLCSLSLLIHNSLTIQYCAITAEGLKAFQSKTRVIGDLNEKEAYGYLFGDKNKNWDGLVNDPRLRDVPAGGEKVWEDIFKVCGGNIGLLRELVIEATAPSNDGWKGGLFLTHFPAFKDLL